jgi:hypothetical protein
MEVRRACASALTVLLAAAMILGTSCSPAVTVTSSIPQYTLAMSSVPGYPLTANTVDVFDQSALEYVWKTDRGSFATWGQSTGFVVNNLGAECTVSDNPVYWSPFEGEVITEETATVTVEVRHKDSKKTVGRATLVIDSSDVYYTIRE